jgi:hypothetical protein
MTPTTKRRIFLQPFFIGKNSLWLSLVERLVRELLLCPSDYAVSKLNRWK